MARIEKRKLGTALLAIAAAPLLLIGGPAQADTAVVQQDATPVVSAPGVGGRVLTRVDTGFTLTVLGREGDWLRVASPRLPFGGVLWVPAARVGEIVAAPDAVALPDAAAAMTPAPQFRITSRMDGGATAPPDAATSIGSRGSTGDSAAAAASPSSSAGGGTARANSTATPTGATQATATPSNSAAAVGDPTPPGGNAVPAQGNPTPAATGNPTPAGGNATPALGNPTPALGNPTPAGGNPTPAMGNSVVGFGTSRTTTQ